MLLVAAPALAGCPAEGPEGTVAGDDTAAACPDTDGDGAPGAVERCNGVDDDCDGAVDGAGLALWTSADGVEVDYSGVFASPDTFTLDGPGTLALCEGEHTAALVIASAGVTIRSMDPARPATLRADGGTVVEVTGEATIEDLVLTGGTSSGLEVKDGGTAVLSGVTIEGNSSFRGGGISAVEGAEVEATACTVSGNSADRGGGIHVDDGKLTLTDCEVSGNSSDSSGGGLDLSDSQVTMNGGSLEANTADEAGGGVSIYDGRVTLDGVRIAGNAASDFGGGIDVSLARLTLMEVVIEGNQGGLAGGAMLATMGAQVTWEGGSMGSNEAGEGGAIWAWGFSINGEGGVVYLEATEVALTDNVATGAGGALHADGASITLESCAVTGNQAEEGGAFRVYQSSLALDGCDVSANGAGERGGGALVESDGAFVELESRATVWGTGDDANEPDTIAFGAGGTFEPSTGEEFTCDESSCTPL